MIRYLLYFCISFATITGLSFAGPLCQQSQVKSSNFICQEHSPLISLSPGSVITTIDSLNCIISTLKAEQSLPDGTTATDIVQWLLRVLGGFLTTLIMYLLHRWFPKIFPSSSSKDYK